MSSLCHCVTAWDRVLLLACISALSTLLQTLIGHASGLLGAVTGCGLDGPGWRTLGWPLKCRTLSSVVERTTPAFQTRSSGRPFNRPSLPLVGFSADLSQRTGFNTSNFLLRGRVCCRSGVDTALCCTVGLSLELRARLMCLGCADRLCGSSDCATSLLRSPRDCTEEGNGSHGRELSGLMLDVALDIGALFSPASAAGQLERVGSFVHASPTIREAAASPPWLVRRCQPGRPVMSNSVREPRESDGTNARRCAAVLERACRR